MIDAPAPAPAAAPEEKKRASINMREFARLYRTLLPAEQKEFIQTLSPEEAYIVENSWDFRAREKQLVPEGNWRYCLFLAGRGWGKALALDTPLPTIDGWTTMGEVQPGDILFDEQGKHCRVTFVTPVMENHVCYEVVFSDGTKIIADAEHHWLTVNRRTRKSLARRTGKLSNKPQSQPKYAPSVVTTEEIANTLYDLNEINHSIDCTEALKLEEIDLPIDPYVLGVWLGDGNSRYPHVTCCDQDVEIIQEIERVGYKVTPYKVKNRTANYGIGAGMSPSLPARLRWLDLISNKHIPSVYLRASFNQRLRLLQGLMDTDGSIEENGNCEFTSTSKKLAEGVYELCMTFGLKATIGIGRATLNGKDCGEKYRISFTPYMDVFHLKRKSARIRKAGKQALRQKRRYIVAVNQVESIPVRCIQVNSPSHLYLASKSFIPTHNTDAIVQWAHQQALAMPGSVGLMVATIASDVRDVLIEGPSGIMVKTPPHERPEYVSTHSLLRWPNGSIARLRSADKPDGLRGLNSWWAIGDEYASWRRPDSLNQILLGLRLGSHPRLVLATTPKPVKHLRKFLERKKLVVVSGSSYENRDNLADDWFDDIVASYAGTDIEQQEIDGVLLDDKTGALWTSKLIEDSRIRNIDAFDFKKLIKIVIAVDPAVSALSGSNFTGIMVVGMDARSHFYVLDDLTIKGSPEIWGRRVVQAYHDWSANLIVGEVNNGGDLVKANIEATEKNLPFKAVHASRGKVMRAEPVVNFYQQGRVHHLGVLAALESQQVEWTNGDVSPDRIDALVWGIWSLAFPDSDDRPPIVRHAIARFNTDLSW